MHHVVGQKAEQRDGQHSEDDLLGPAGRLAADAGDATHGQWVTHQDDDGGQQGAEDQAECAVVRDAATPLALGKVLEAAAAAGRAVLVLALQWAHEDEDEDGDAEGHPEERADCHSVTGVLELQVAVRVYHGHIAVHTDAGHEADADVDVGVPHGAGHAARHVSKGPVVPLQVVVDAEGQREEDGDVGQRQVHDVHAGRGAWGNLEQENEEGDQVAGQP